MRKTPLDGGGRNLCARPDFMGGFTFSDKLAPALCTAFWEGF